MMKNWIVGLFSGLVCVTLLVLSGGARADETSQPEDDPASKSQELKTHEVKAGRLKIDVELTGTFESGEMSPLMLRPKSWSTLIVDKSVSHGKKVNKGDPLVWLETEKLDEAIVAAEYKVKSAEASLKQGEADLQLARELLPLDLKSIELAKQVADENLLDYLKEDRTRSIASTQRSLDSSRFALEYVQEELDQLKKMYEADDLTEETEEIILKRAERSVDSSKFALESAEVRTARRLERDIPRMQQRLVDAAKRQDHELQRAKLALPASVETKRLAVEKQRSDLEIARKNLAKLKQDREAMIVKAPADGIVYYGRCVRGKWLDLTKAEGMLKPGGTLAAKQAFITIVSSQPLDIRVELAEANLSQVKQGIEGTATPTGFPDLRLPVKVSRVPHIPLNAGVYDCLLSVTDDAKLGPVIPGMTCKIKLVTYDKQDVLTVPPAAVHQDEDDEDKSFVYLLEDDKPIRRDVETGRRNDKAVEIVKGLKAGDKVLLEKPE